MDNEEKDLEEVFGGAAKSLNKHILQSS